jgi:hypothetical protein
LSNFNVPAFAPGGATVNLTATAVTDIVQIQDGRNSRHIRIWNSGTVPVFVEFGDDAVEADAAVSMPIAPGNTEVLTCPFEYVAAITESGSAKLYITPGEGL